MPESSEIGTALATGDNEGRSDASPGGGLETSAILAISAVLQTPDLTEMVLAEHGLWVEELVNTSPEGNAPEGPISVCRVSVPPGGSTKSHYHATSTAYVLVLSAGPEGAITQAGSNMDEIYVQHALGIVVIPRKKRHRVHNRSETHWVHALEFRDCESAFDDRILEPEWDGVGFDLPAPLVLQHHVGSADAVTDGRFG